MRVGISCSILDEFISFSSVEMKFENVRRPTKPL